MKALAIILVIPFATLFAFDNNGRGTKATSLANAFVGLADNSWAISYNPAGLAQILSPEISTFFVPQQFGISELKTVSLSAACRIGPGTIGALAEQFGFDLYHTTDFALAYGYSIDSSFSVGAAVDVQRTSIDRYGASNTFLLDVGFLGKPISNLSVGVCVKNLTATTIGVNHERLPQYFLLGVCYSPVKDFSLVSEVEKDPRFPLVLKAGVEQKFLDFLSLRCGIANNPDKFSAGVSIQFTTFEFGYAGYSHSELGWTHQLEIKARWGM